MKFINTLFILLIFLNYHHIIAQIDSSILKLNDSDSLVHSLNMDAVYKRPLFSPGNLPLAIGGYAEVNWQHIGTDGVSEGHQIQMRRLTLFIAAAISQRIKFLSEIEFEDGGNKIALEFAAIDIEFSSLFNVRAGIVLNPIGAFNQNHDGPKWEFTDRPLSATSLLPATWSNAAFGLYGKYYSSAWMFGYETYLSNGFDPSIIENDLNKTFLPASKNNPERFDKANLLFTGKIGIRNFKIGEIGLSYMGGIYNNYTEDGLTLDNKRYCKVYAVDFNSRIPGLNTQIIGEWAWVNIDIPSTYTQQFGNKQHGGFLDIVQPILEKEILGWPSAVLNLSCRFEYVDWNVGNFNENNTDIGDQLWSIMPALSFRPTQQTVLRINYRIQRQMDIFKNPAAKTAGFNIGLSSYF